MKKILWSLILVVGMASLYSAFAEEGVCYNPTRLNLEGNTLQEICIGGQIYDNLEDITGPVIHYTPIGAYKPGRISTGVFLPQSHYNNTYIGYWGTNFTDRIIKMPVNNTPIGMFQKYKNKSNIFFPPQEEKTYTSKKVFFPGQNTNNPSGGNIKNTQSQCPPPQTLTNQKIEMVNNGYTDQIKISFDPTLTTTQVKVVQIFPQSEATFLTPGKYEYRTTPKYAQKNYQYILVSYNTCNEMQYSNVLSITTGEQAQKNPDQTLLTNEKALTLITNERNPVDSLYFLVPKINPSENLTTGKLALFLINLKTDIVIEDAALALKTLQSLGIIDAEKTLQSSINLGELHTILDKIQKSSSFEQDVLSAVNNVFSLTAGVAYGQLMKLLILQEHLQSEPLFSRNVLFVCLNDKGCSDIPYYRNFMNAVLQDIASHSLSPQTLGIDVSNNSVLTLQEYIRLVFLVLGAREFVQSGASTQDYQLLMSILMQSVSQGEERASQNMTYYDQMRLSLAILESHLFDKVVFVTHNYLRTILQIYASVEKRGVLFEILGDYLGE